VPLVSDGTFCSESGASGTRLMIAPLPRSDVKEVPSMFVADTVAKILAPH